MYILLRFIEKNKAPPRTNFDDFQNAMLAVFQVGGDRDEKFVNGCYVTIS